MSHETVEKNVGLLVVLTLLVISVGGLIEVVPLVLSAAKSQGSAAGGFRYLRAGGVLPVPFPADTAISQ
jgi:cbb3-type cytochrome oxidase cytochrome c subunit